MQRLLKLVSQSFLGNGGLRVSVQRKCFFVQNVREIMRVKRVWKMEIPLARATLNDKSLLKPICKRSKIIYFAFTSSLSYIFLASGQLTEDLTTSASVS